MSNQIIVFYRGRKYAKSWLLAWWQKSDFSHCETVVRAVADVYECAGAKFIGGVAYRKRQLHADDWEAWEIPVDVDFAKNWMVVHEGDRYDPIGLLGFIFRRIKGAFRAWFCSEACAAMAGFQDAWRFDVATLRAVCMRIGKPYKL